MFEISVYFILRHISDEMYFTSQQAREISGHHGGRSGSIGSQDIIQGHQKGPLGRQPHLGSKHETVDVI